jgi:hypothetical protein
VIRAALAFALLCAAPASAKVMPLAGLPPEKLVALAPVLKHGDIALIESFPDGTMKQVTLILYVAAPPEVVHEVVASPAAYKTFVPNVTRSDWTAGEGGVGTLKWKLELPVSSFENVNLYRFDAGAAAPVHVWCPGENDDATYRWEMLPAGGGTVLVQYGYTDVKHSNAFVRSFLKKMPVSEHGLALAAQLLLAAPMKREAEKRAGARAAPPEGAGPGFGFLLDRGVVAVLRSLPGGRLADLSMLERVPRSAAEVARALTAVSSWRGVPGVDEARELGRSAGTFDASVTFAVPVISWSSRWSYRFTDRIIEGAAISGDLRGAHLRWDLTPRGDNETLVVYRVNERFAQSSTIFRKLVEHDATLEHGLTLAFNLVWLRALAR